MHDSLINIVYSHLIILVCYWFYFMDVKS